MKKFLALMFVCAGLTAMAAPHVNKADLAQVNKGQMVMKANTMANELTHSMVSQEFMAAAKKNVQRTSTSNLVNKRAPRRLSDAEIINNPYVCFLYAATYDENGNHVEEDPFFAGGGASWYPNTSDGLYFAGFYWDEQGSTYYLPINIDYTTGDVSLTWGLLLRNDTTTNGGGRNRIDTVRWHAILSEDYFLNNQQNDCKGHIYEDGSIIFDDNYVYYREMYIKTYKNNSLSSTDTIVDATVFMGTEILAANGILNYTNEKDNKAASSYTYMFQNETADSLFVGNMWNYGVPNIVLTINSDAKANYNCIGEVGEDGTTYLDNPIWDIDDSYIDGGLGMCYGVSGYTMTEDGQYIDEFIWGFDGDVTPDKITWDYTAPCNGYHLFYGYKNNELTWLNGGKFEMPAPPAPEFVRGDVNGDEVVTIDDVTALIDALLKDDFDNVGEGTDCNEDGSYTIDDVTTLIDYLLKGQW